jgi:hypothetical protein
MDRLTLTVDKLTELLFKNAWAFIVPYVLMYVVFERIDGSVSLLRTFFRLGHGVLLFLLLVYLARRPGKVPWSIAGFWFLLFLLFFIPGAYLEYPSDPWEHFRRIFSWQRYDLISDNPNRLRFAYFWIWSWFGSLSPAHRILALNITSAFWQLLLAGQFYRLFRRLGFDSRWALVQMLGTVVLFGTNLFGFYRYYALSATPLSYIAYLQAMLMLIDLLDPSARNRNRPNFYVPKILLLLLSVLIIYYNHFQELIFLGISTFGLLFYFVYARASLKRVVVVGLAVFTLIAWLLGYLLPRFPAMIADVHWYPDASHISALGTFRLWGIDLPYLETLGLHGLLGVALALLLWRKYTRLAILTLAPVYMALFPPFVLAFSLANSSAYITYRVLFAFPTSVMVIAGVQNLFSNWPKGLRRRPNEKQQVIVAVALLLLVALPPYFPLRGRLWFQLYMPPASLTLQDTVQTVEWLTDHPEFDSSCLLPGDNATDFVLATQFALPAADRRRAVNISQAVIDASSLQELVATSGACGLLLAMPENQLVTSTVAELSGHWSPTNVRRALTPESDLEALAEPLLDQGWRRVFVPPYYWLYYPQQ